MIEINSTKLLDLHFHSSSIQAFQRLNEIFEWHRKKGNS